MKIKIVCDDKYLPKYANETDACMDIKARIIDNKPRERMFDDGYVLSNYPDTENSLFIFPRETKVIDTGLKVAVPEGYVMLMFVRSSTGIKRNLVLANGTGVIDAGYRDEIKLALYNTGKSPVEICDGERLAQFIILPFPKLELLQVEDNLVFRKGDRGGGIGSSGS